MASGLQNVQVFSNTIPVRNFVIDDFNFDSVKADPDATKEHPLDLKPNRPENEGCYVIYFYAPRTGSAEQLNIFSSVSTQSQLPDIGFGVCAITGVVDATKWRQLFNLFCYKKVFKGNEYGRFCGNILPYTILYLNRKPRGFIRSPYPFSTQNFIDIFNGVKSGELCDPEAKSPLILDKPGTIDVTVEVNLVSNAGQSGLDYTGKTFDLRTEEGKQKFEEERRQLEQKREQELQQRIEAQKQTNKANEEYKTKYERDYLPLTRQA